jgi:outer membrane protein TolC
MSLRKLPAVAVLTILATSFRVALAADPWTLDRAIGYALTNSPDARIAAHRIKAARAGVDQANAAAWPLLQLQSSYWRTDNPMMAFGAILNQRSFSPMDFNDVPEVDNLNVRGVLGVPLYAGGQIRAAREGAKAGAAAARLEAMAVRNTLGFEVARVFHTALKTREFVHATEAAVTSYDSSLTIARKRHAAGTLLKTDVLDVEVRLAQAREDLARARNAQRLATRTLGTLLGLEGEEVTVADAAPEVAPPAGLDVTQRPELLAAHQRRRAAEAEVRGARGGYLPRLSAFGSVEYDYGWELDGDGRSWMAGAQLEWNLWDGRLTRAKVAAAQAGLDSQIEEERKLRLGLNLDLEQARLSLEEATERLAVTDRVVAQAAESVQLVQARFEQGLALSAQVIDAETALTAARVRRAEAEADRRIAVAALRKAAGLSQLD